MTDAPAPSGGTSLRHADPGPPEAALLRALSRLELLHVIDRAILGAVSVDELAGAIARPMLELTGADRVVIARYDTAANTAIRLATARRWTDEPEPLDGAVLPLARLLGGHVMDPRELVVIPDLATTRIPSPAIELMRAQGLGAAAFLPLAAGDALVGSVVISGFDDTFLTDEHLQVATEVAAQLSIAIHQADTRRALELQAARLELIHEIDDAILAADTTDAIAPRVAEPLRRLIGAERLDIAAFDMARDTGRVIAHANSDAELATPAGTEYRLSDVFPAEILERRETRVYPDLAAIAGEIPFVRRAVAQGLRLGVWVPLVAEGQLTGAIGCAGSDPAMASPDALALVRSMGDQLALAMLRGRDRDALAEREARLETLLAASPNGLLLVGTDGRIRYANDAAARMLGAAAPDELQQRTLFEVVPPSLEARHPDFVGAWFATAPAEPTAHPLGTEARRLDGSVFPVHVLLARVAGPEPLALATLVDLTDRTALEARLRQAERLETLGQFAGILAHDVRNHLAAVTWSAELVLDGLPADDPNRPDVELILQGANDAVAMTKSVLDFARPTGDARGRTDVRAHLAQLGPMLARILGAGVVLDLDVADDLPAAGISATALSQVVVNLATNARDAMPDGGTFRVVGRSHRPPADPGTEPATFVRLEVSDTGIGMDEATQHRAFDPFYTTKRGASTAEGTGLGLSSVFLVVTGIGGAIRAASVPGGGTTFTVDLPALEA